MLAVVLDFFLLLDFFFLLVVDLGASADAAGAIVAGAVVVAAGAAGAVAFAGAAGVEVCAWAVSANALATRAIRSLLICRFFRGWLGLTQFLRVAAVNAGLCVPVDTSVTYYLPRLFLTF